MRLIWHPRCLRRDRPRPMIHLEGSTRPWSLDPSPPGPRPAMYGDAVFGGAGRPPWSTHRFRYLLWRCWEPEQEQLTFILCNPSRAGGLADGALRSDPTVDRLIDITLRATRPVDSYWSISSPMSDQSSREVVAPHLEGTGQQEQPRGGRWVCPTDWWWVGGTTAVAELPGVGDPMDRRPGALVRRRSTRFPGTPKHPPGNEGQKSRSD